MAKDFISFPDMQVPGAGFDMLGDSIRKAQGQDDKNKDVFKAVVLKSVSGMQIGATNTSNNVGAKDGKGNRQRGAITRAYFVRILGDGPHSYLPDPCVQGSTGIAETPYNHLIQAMHTYAIDQSGQSLNTNDIVLVRLEKGDFGYDTDTGWIVGVVGAQEAGTVRAKIGFDCAGASSVFQERSAEKQFAAPPLEPAPVYGGVPSSIPSEKPSNADVDRTKIKFSFNDAYAMRNDFMSIKEYIKSGEGIYESVYGQTSGYRDPVNNQKVTEMTLKYLIGEAMPRIYNKNKTSTAAGAYQFLKGTLIETVDYFDKNQPPPPAAHWDSGPVIYNQATQDALVMHLLLVKRPIMGNYILGLHDNYEEAAQQMAYEWASIPIQYSVTSPLEKCNKTMQRGQGAYDGCSGNAVSRKKTPEGVVQILNEARQEASTNPIIQDILKRNGKTATDDAIAMAKPVATAETESESFFGFLDVFTS